MAITDTINCTCDDITNYRTFAQLRSALYAALGFVDPLTANDARALSVLRAELFRMLGFAAMGATYPPGMSALLDDWLNEAQQHLWRRLGLTASLPARMTADADLNVLDATAVLAMACYLAKSHYGKADAKEWKEIALGGIRFPPGGKAAVEQHLKSAHALIHRRYDALRTERWFSWNLTAGVALYDFPQNAERQGVTPQCTKTIDPYKVRWVGVKEADGAWRPLTQGIPPHALGYTTGGPPTHFDFRQCIQLWPAPTVTQGQLVIRAHFNPDAFAADADKPSVDDELVYLLALAQAKTAFQQQDAQLYLTQFEVHLGKLIAGSHGTARYIPGGHADTDYTYTAPKPSVPFV